MDRQVALTRWVQPCLVCGGSMNSATVFNVRSRLGLLTTNNALWIDRSQTHRLTNKMRALAIGNSQSTENRKQGIWFQYQYRLQCIKLQPATRQQTQHRLTHTRARTCAHVFTVLCQSRAGVVVVLSIYGYKGWWPKPLCQAPWHQYSSIQTFNFEPSSKFLAKLWVDKWGWNWILIVSFTWFSKWYMQIRF